MGESSSFSGTLRKRRMEAIRIKRSTEKDKGISQMFEIKKDEDFYEWLNYIGVTQQETEKAYEICTIYGSEAFEFYFRKGDSVETTKTELEKDFLAIIDHQGDDLLYFVECYVDDICSIFPDYKVLERLEEMDIINAFHENKNSLIIFKGNESKKSYAIEFNKNAWENHLKRKRR